MGWESRGVGKYKPRGGVGRGWGVNISQEGRGGREGSTRHNPIANAYCFAVWWSCFKLLLTLLHVLYYFLRFEKPPKSPSPGGRCWFQEQKTPAKHPRQHTEDFGRPRSQFQKKMFFPRFWPRNKDFQTVARQFWSIFRRASFYYFCLQRRHLQTRAGGNTLCASVVWSLAAWCSAIAHGLGIQKKLRRTNKQIIRRHKFI